ncbi:response regulator transcription factor [Luteococcus peritonei]|uniref:Response regulator n=1 Tax=Luteococcus peritonei TaxID=88874 RepID=A0ABW4RXT9_9ACTN
MRIALVDDDPMVRTGLGYILAGEPDLEVAWQAGDGAEALERLEAADVEVMLLDIRMPGVDGLATLEALARRPQRPRVLVLTTFNTDDYVVRALKLGADGFLLKDADPADLVDAVRRVAQGQNVLSPQVTRTLIGVATEGGGPTAAAQQAVAALSEREREVAVLVAQGLTNSQISTRMNLSLASVKAHLTSTFTKLGVDNRVSVAMLVRDAGL